MGRFGSFLLGGAIGAGIALLFAPRTGEETRALVAEKADEYWGKGQDLYGQGKTRIQDGVASVPSAVNRTGDELREKIDNARVLIAEQVAKNAAAARDAINEKVPVAAERINSAADVVRGHIDAALSDLKDRVAGSIEDDKANAGAESAPEKIEPDSSDGADVAPEADTPGPKDS
jgi:gas vesicle protein